MRLLGIDNNLTRKVSQADAVSTAALKGIAAGIVNIALALSTGASLPGRASLGGALALRFVSYGLSLVWFHRRAPPRGRRAHGRLFFGQLRLSERWSPPRFW